MSKTNKDKLIVHILLVVIAVYGIACGYLYYNQQFWAQTGSFESDLPFHISMVVEDHWFYSLTAIFYLLFFKTSIGPVLTASFLTLITLATIYATYLLVKELTNDYYTAGMNLLLAFFSNIIMPFYISVAGKQRYIAYQSPSIWHNSTYMAMKLLGVITLWYFLKLRDKYMDGLKIGEWLTFAVLLILCNAAKPSFCFAFDPVMLVILIYDLIKKDDKTFLQKLKRIIVFGLSVIPSLLVILWQNAVLFGDDTGNGIVINPGFALAMRGEHPKVTFILSIIFPLFVLICNLSDIKWDKRFRLAWMMWVVAFLQVFLLTEEGGRAAGSNFFWGYSMAIFFVNLISMIKMLENLKRKEGIYENETARTIISATSAVILSYQCYCGIYFFVNLLTGKSYWM